MTDPLPSDLLWQLVLSLVGLKLFDPLLVVVAVLVAVVRVLLDPSLLSTLVEFLLVLLHLLLRRR